MYKKKVFSRKIYKKKTVEYHKKYTKFQNGEQHGQGPPDVDNIYIYIFF